MAPMKDPWDFDATPEELHQMALTGEQHIREWVTQNPNTASETLALLAHPSEPHSVRMCVAQHQNTPIECLADMSRNLHLCKYVALNPVTPPAILAGMAIDTYSWEARYHIVRNQNTPTDVWLAYKKVYGRLPP